MDFLLHSDFDMHNDKKITAHFEYKKVKENPEQNKVHAADLLQPISSESSLFIPSKNIRKPVGFRFFSFL